MSGEKPQYFFSYARGDSEFVLELAKELRKAGADVWLDQLDILGGQRWDEAIEEALQRCGGVIAVLSPASVASRNFMDEVSYALEEGKHVVPVLHRDCAIPFRLRRLQYVDFTGDAERGYADLLRALELEGPEVDRGPGTERQRGPGSTTAADEEPQEQKAVGQATPEPEWPAAMRNLAAVAFLGAVCGQIVGFAEAAHRSGWQSFLALGLLIIASIGRLAHHFRRWSPRRTLLSQLELVILWATWTVSWCLAYSWYVDFLLTNSIILVILALGGGVAFTIRARSQRRRGD